MANITVHCVINGKTIDEHPHDDDKLADLVEKALKKAKATARPPEDWTVSLDGRALDQQQTLKAQGVGEGTTLFFSLGGSESGAS